MAQLQGNTGPQVLGDGAQGAVVRMGRGGELVTQDLHGRFYEQTLRGAVFTGGMDRTTISNATFTTTTTDATATPIIGLYNPTGSGVNAILLQAQLNVTMTALQATGCGGFTWMVTAAAGPLTLGSTPFRTSGLAQAGSGCKLLAGVAMTGKTGALVVLRGSCLGGGSSTATAFLATQAGMQTTHLASVENFDGSIILPPNTAIGLFATATPVGHSAASGLVWEEVAV